jgi:hypothetical protein
MRKRARKPKHDVATEEQSQLLQQLKEIAVAVGLDVREERLQREVGYSVRSGSCRVDGRDVVLLDSNAAASERIDVMLDVLAESDLDGVYIEPELRERIAGRAGKERRDETPDDGGGEPSDQPAPA